MDLLLVIPVACIITLICIIYLIRYVFQADKGDEDMQQIAQAIKEGAMAFLKRQYITIATLTLVVAVILGWVSHSWHTPVSFIIGASCSALAGFIGMYVSVNANLRTAAAARRGLNDALKISFRGGSVTG